MITDRIKQMEKTCAQRSVEENLNHFQYDYYTAALTKYHALPLWEKAARSTAYAIENLDIYAYPEDRIGGRVYYAHLKPADQIDPTLDANTMGDTAFAKEYPNAQEMKVHQLIGTASRGHIAWHWEWLLSMGVEGMQKKVQDLLSGTDDPKSQEFYQGVLIELDALLAFNDKHIPVYEAMGNAELAQLMQKVPRKPAETFREAVQAFFMQHIVVMAANAYGGNSPGRLDYFLWPYLERDLQAGRCTLEEAKEIVDELFLRIDERIHTRDAWGETIVAGGTKPDGSSAVNPLTYIMTQTMIDLNITHPYFYLRLPENPPEELWKLAVRYLMEGHNRAQILSDPAIIRALQGKGVPFEDAVNYVCGGCMEISVQGAHSDFLYSGWQNIPKMLELMITGGICLRTRQKLNSWQADKGLAAYSDFESFYQDFIAEAKRITHIYMYHQDLHSKAAETARPSFLISSMIDDCLARGRNMHAGGARYHDYGASPAGLPNVADALYTISQAVFEQKLCTGQELMDAIKADFEGYEPLRLQLRSIGKFGIDDDRADALAARLTSDFADMYTSYRTKDGGTGIPVILTFQYAPRAAANLGATADGRHAFGTIAHGVTPYSASMTEGVTAAINSCMKLPFEKLSGGASTMWDFDSDMINADLMEAILKTFVQKGGQIFQGNTTPVEELQKALEKPEDYGHLLVRVGGYSARFVNLEKGLQMDIINRLRHCN